MTEALKLTLTLPSRLSLLAFISRVVLDALAQVVEPGIHHALAPKLDVCLSEAVTNAITHAHKGDPLLAVTVALSVAAGDVTLSVTDHGPGFDFDGLKVPELEELREHGRGIHIIRQTMRRVTYKQGESGNVLEMSIPTS